MSQIAKHAKLLQDVKELGEKISLALSTDVQRGKESKNANYRSKRIEEATVLWDTFNAKLVELKNVLTRLITAKTRVAPVSSKISLPRLELCGALLVSNLLNTVKRSLRLDDISTYLWTDSMITLGWLNKEPNRWKTFVANRVAEIKTNNNAKWNYVPTDHNPADCASRGLMPMELLNHSLWWTGPSWLQEDASRWPTAEIPEHDLEQKNQLLINMALVSSNDTVTKVSSWYTLKRLAAYCLRFKTKQCGRLTVAELQASETSLIRRCQEESFHQEIDDLTKNQQVNKKSSLKSLNVFLDERGLLRVGGRLTNATIPYGTRHPMVLPKEHHITKILIHQMHIDTHHGGPKLMRSLLMRKYWIIQGKRLITTECAQCISCRKFKGDLYKQQMGNLPEVRVTLQRAFGYTGVDYAGPIELKSSNLRSARIQKGYIAVYVCMGTKAVHLELVSNHTTEAFLASFNRFVARRGLPTAMYSDNGSCFVGADNKLQRSYLVQQNAEVAKVVINRNVEWHFIPPGAPNFGGLWERGVRTMKEHMKRLTFEEYSTLLCNIEACMNSRPLCALSDDIESLDALTPGHFLIGQALLAPPQPDVGIKQIDNRSRWTYVNVLYRQLWDRWNTEYLLELQQRHKWQEISENAKPGDLVAVKDEDLVPRNWLVGRIEEVHKGADGNVRVATIRVPSRAKDNDETKLVRPNQRSKVKLTADGRIDLTKQKHMTSKLIQRPIRKLCPLITNSKETAMIAHRNTITKPTKVPTRAYNLRPRTSAKLLIMACAFFCVLLGTVMTDSNECVAITPFDYNSGIYFEFMGRANMAIAEWKMLIYFDLQTYNDDITKIQDIVTKMDTLCKTAEESMDVKVASQCSHTIKMLTEQINDIIQMNVVLQSNKQAISSPRRKRAAPFNFIGWVGHELFGIMDASSAEKLEKRITDFKSDIDNQHTLLQEQTSVMELTANLLRESQKDTQRQFKILADSIITLSNETDLSRKREQIIGWALYISLIINRLEKIQQNMINMLTDLQQGHVSSFLFTPKQFKHELDMINDHIINGQKLPVKSQHDMKSFYEIMRGQLRVTTNNILLEISLPLVSIEEFQVFHLIPIPVQYGSDNMCIIPESKYLLITLKRNLFYQFNEAELNNCIQPKDTPMICPDMQPLHTVDSSNGKCERELLAGIKQFSDKCNINVTRNADIWVQLKTKNRWIYGLQKTITLNIVKASNVDTITLQGSGILSIQPGCEINHRGFTIVGKSQIITNGSWDFQPMVNLSDVMDNNTSKLNIFNYTLAMTDQVQNINTQLHKVRTYTKLQHDTENTVQNSLMAILFCGGLCYILWKYKHKVLRFVNQNRNHISQQNGQQQSPNSIDHAANVEQISNSGDNGSVDNSQELKRTVDHIATNHN